MPCRPASREDVWVRGSTPLREIDVDRLARLLRNLEANRPPCFALSNGGSIDGITMGCHISNPQAYQVAPPKFAVDGEIEQGEISKAFQQLESRSDRPNMFRAKRRLGPGELALVPRLSDSAIRLDVNMRIHLGSSVVSEGGACAILFESPSMSAFRAERTIQVEVTR